MEPGESMAGGVILPAGVSASEPTPTPAIRTTQVPSSSDNVRQRSWTQDDTRGWGQWIAQSN